MSRDWLEGRLGSSVRNRLIMDQSANLDYWQQVDSDQVGLGALNFAGYEAQGGPATATAGTADDTPVPTGDTREINGIDLSLLDFGADSKDGKSDPSTETFEIDTEGSARRAKEKLSPRLDIEEEDQEIREDGEEDGESMEDRLQKMMTLMEQAMGSASTEPPASNVNLLMTMMMSQYLTMQKEMTKLRGKSGKDEDDANKKLRLPKIPFTSNHGVTELPTTVAWRDWLLRKFRPWGRMVCSGFENWILQNLFRRRASPLSAPGEKKSYTVANALLAHELSQSIDHGLANYFTNIDSCDGHRNLYQLDYLVNRKCEEKISGLRQRFDHPKPCSGREKLYYEMVSWLKDLDELARLGSRVDKHATLSSLKTLIAPVAQELKVSLESLDMTHPGNPKMLFIRVLQKTNL